MPGVRRASALAALGRGGAGLWHGAGLQQGGGCGFGLLGRLGRAEIGKIDLLFEALEALGAEFALAGTAFLQ